MLRFEPSVFFLQLNEAEKKKSVCHFGLDWLMEKHQLNCQSCDEKCCRQCPRGVN